MTYLEKSTVCGAFTGKTQRSAGNVCGGLDESELAALLDAYPHDHNIHRAMIERDELPAGIADRLLRLTGAHALREELISRHDFSSDIDRDPIKASRDRPPWWY